MRESPGTGAEVLRLNRYLIQHFQLWIYLVQNLTPADRLVRLFSDNGNLMHEVIKRFSAIGFTVIRANR